MGIEPATFRIVAQCLDELRYRVPQMYARLNIFVNAVNTKPKSADNLNYNYILVIRNNEAVLYCMPITVGALSKA
jgi:hypothetical protein